MKEKVKSYDIYYRVEKMVCFGNSVRCQTGPVRHWRHLFIMRDREVPVKNNYMEVIIMRIQHNIMALNSNRQLGINNSAVARSLEKLSSGYRINRAGDDAAGLAISEKM